MSDTPETQEAVERWRQGKINIFDEMARLERERDEARADCEHLNRLLRAETALGQGEIDHWAALERERDEARDLAYKLYWVAWDLKRFARAYAGGYKEADDKEGVAKAEEDFYEACKDLVDVLGMDDE